MKGFKEKTFADRLQEAADARKTALERFKSRPAPDDPEVIRRREERLRIAQARDEREAVRKAQKEVEAAARAEREAAERVERELIVRALKQTSHNVTHAARLLKISRKSLQMKMKELGLREER